MSVKYEVHLNGALVGSFETFKAAFREYEYQEKHQQNWETLELKSVTEQTLLSTAEKLSSERGYASKNG